MVKDLLFTHIIRGVLDADEVKNGKQGPLNMEQKNFFSDIEYKIETTKSSS